MIVKIVETLLTFFIGGIVSYIFFHIGYTFWLAIDDDKIISPMRAIGYLFISLTCWVITLTTIVYIVSNIGDIW